MKKDYAVTNQPPSVSVGDRIRVERRNLSLTQEELSRALGISVSYLSCIERGKRKVSAYVLHQLHQFFNLSYDYLLEGQNLFDARYSHYLKESSGQDMDSKLHTLILTCSGEEKEMCYRICHSYLVTNRRKNHFLD